ncbi:TonB-dependent receptor [Flavobacteriaceae bacterium S0825]|uniref:TonB-dependent receptor plug domain-containing protein n=1 Tax=Gaetbulibacter sp. S0825 TaxID=2720084 RepID=UPI00142FDE93|nr:TonB-dependent receptor plug domain-containing protein [Gaetbulibacter sp. S0825]MCK0109331.1 TonB-dependent receptor [Flavobacteriaceae bacterium S0825]NIX64965.1 TonB-dependent receptor [Gaetbulibacter sp. S0825]
MNKKTCVLSVCCTLMSAFGFSQEDEVSKTEQLDEVVITNSRFEIKREDSGKVITKITQKELEKLQGKSIAEIINNTVGIEINGAKSNAGQNLSYFVRGGRNRQVLILIDGIALSDASQIANDYDLRLLNANQVESIEILKGASSALYGSGAATAVIDIKLKEASKKTISANFRSVLGSNQSQNDNDYHLENFKNSVSINGTVNKFNYLASFGNQFADGLSAIKLGSEKDAFNTINGHLKMGYKFSNVFNFSMYGSFDKYKADFDDGFMFQDADNMIKTNQHRIGMSSNYKYKNGSIIVNAATNNIERDVTSNYPNIYKAKSYLMDLYNKYNFNDTFYTVLGMNYQDNRMESFEVPFGSTSLEQSISPNDATFTIVDPYVNVVYTSNFGLNINSGLRFNNHSEYGSHFVYSINPSFKKNFTFGYIKGLVSYSTAYITPSLYQLFEPTYGNINLKPEENATLEIGAELNITNKMTTSIVYFNRKETNFIDFVDLGNWVFQYKNTDESFTASGVEVIADYKISSKVSIKANATYTKVEDDLNLRIPKIKVNTKLNYQVNDHFFMSASYQFNDDRNDTFYNNVTFANEDVTLKSYSLLDFYASHKLINNKVTLFTNVTNILNSNYEELYGYSTKGRNITFGFNLSF